MHQKRHQPLHQVQPLQQPQQPLPRHTSVNRHGVVVALEDDDLDLLQVRMICNVQWVRFKQCISRKDYQTLKPQLFSKSTLISSLYLINSTKSIAKKGQNVFLNSILKTKNYLNLSYFFQLIYAWQFTNLMKKKSILFL